MAGYFGGNLGNIPDVSPFESRQRRAWWPYVSTESGELLWLRKYWQITTYKIALPSSPEWPAARLHHGFVLATKVYRLTEEEYLLYILSKSPA